MSILYLNDQGIVLNMKTSILLDYNVYLKEVDGAQEKAFSN